MKLKFNNSSLYSCTHLSRLKRIRILIVLFYIGLIFIPIASANQLPGDPVTDSLKNELGKAASQKEKINILYEISKAYYSKSDANSALENNNILLETISKYGTKADSAKYFRLTGLIYLKMAWFDKSLDNLMRSQQLFAETGDSNLHARSLMNIGIVHDNMGNIPMSLAYYNKALNYYKRNNDEAGMADCELNIAIILTKQQNYEKACENLISAAGIYEKTGNTSNLAAAYINLGLTYKKMDNYALAIDYLNRANEIWKLDDDQYHICHYHLNMGEIMLDLGKPEQALEHLTTAEKLAAHLGAKDIEVRAYEFLADYNAKVNNFKMAYSYLNKSKLLNDSILNAETTDKVNQIQYHYEIAKRETENEKLVKQNLNKELQISKKNLTLYILSGIILLIAVLVILLVNQNRLKRDANHQLEAKNNLIEAQKDELIKLNASKDKFLSILAHDIKNPLSSIYGISELLVKDYDKLTPDEKKVFTQDIHTLSTNLFEIINTLLSWSTSQSGLIAYRPKTFDISVLTAKTIHNLETVAKQKDIKILNQAGESVLVVADENMMYSVLHNLINNAIKFSYPGSDIKIMTSLADKFVEISVIDSGMGLSPENQEKLFRYDQHFLGKGTAGESGTGLGLILCNDFVQKNGGTIRVESNLKKGSTFVFTVPLPTT